MMTSKAFKKPLAFYTGLFYFMSMAALLVIRILFAVGLFKGASAYAQDLIFGALAQLAAMGAISFLGYYIIKRKGLTGRPPFDFFGFKGGVGAKNWLKIFVISFLSPIVVWGFSAVWQTLLDAVGYNKGISSGGGIYTWQVYLIEILFTACLPALFEEIANRGMLYKGLEKKTPLKRIIITAMMFALMHQNIVQTGYTFLSGIILGALVVTTGSLWPAVFAHFINNALSCTIDFATNRGALNFLTPFSSWYYYNNWGRALSVVVFLAAAVVIVVLLYSLYLHRKPRLKVYTVYDTALKLSETEALAYYPEQSENTATGNIFLYAAIVMNSVATIFSLVWGIMK